MDAWLIETTSLQSEVVVWFFKVCGCSARAPQTVLSCLFVWSAWQLKKWWRSNTKTTFFPCSSSSVDCGFWVSTRQFLLWLLLIEMVRTHLNSCKMNESKVVWYAIVHTYFYINLMYLWLAKVPPNSGGIIPDWLPNLFFGGILEKTCQLHGGNGWFQSVGCASEVWCVDSCALAASRS